MTAHELLENAVKYSISQDTPVTCALLMGDGTVGLRVSNWAEPAHKDVLKAQFAEVMDGDPLEVYLAKMQASLGSDHSQLGLARIRYEGEARMALIMDEATVTVEAIFDIGSAEGATNEQSQHRVDHAWFDDDRYPGRCEGTLVLKFKGNIDQSNPGEFMDPLLDQVHDRVLANKTPSVVADFTDLQFCNSSASKP